MHGTPQANHAVHNADLILAVGTRFVDRTTGVFQGFAPGARIVHVDIDPVEIGKNIPVWRFLLGDARTALAAILERSPRMEHGDWLARIVSWTHSASLPLHHDVDTPSPRQVMEALQKVVGNDITIVADVGQNQMWAARYFIYDRPNSYHTSGGLGTMGFALPAALGAAVADPSTPVWVISGDGGFQMSQQELATLAHERIPVKIIVFNNGYLGMVRQWQQLFHQQRYVATPLGGPDLGLLAKAHGFGGTVVSKSSRVEAALLQAVSSPGPFLLEFRIAGEENVYPIVVPGGSLVDVLDRSNDNV
jgi:acetolactate synthase-1/2/3 large subunit